MYVCMASLCADLCLCDESVFKGKSALTENALCGFVFLCDCGYTILLSANNNSLLLSLYDEKTEDRELEQNLMFQNVLLKRSAVV